MTRWGVTLWGHGRYTILLDQFYLTPKFLNFFTLILFYKKITKNLLFTPNIAFLHQNFDFLN